jgi:hypothetical protein
MHRAARAFALAILVITGFALMFREGSGQETQPGPVTQPTLERDDRVEVEHVIITAEEVQPIAAAPAPSANRPARKTPAPTRSSAPAAFRSAMNNQKAPTLGEKTRRALLGDGRYKPQPFPRINNN